MKRKHLALILMVLVGVILLAGLYQFPNILGFATKDPSLQSSSYTNGFDIGLFDVYYKGNIVSADFSLRENAGKNRDLSVNYEMFNGQGEIFGKGSMDVILEANSQKSYGFSFKPDKPTDIASLSVEVIDKKTEERVYSSIIINNNAITGNVINEGESPIKLGTIFFTFVVFLAALFYVLKMIYAKRVRKEILSKFHEGHLINIR